MFWTLGSSGSARRINNEFLRSALIPYDGELYKEPKYIYGMYTYALFSAVSIATNESNVSKI